MTIRTNLNPWRTHVKTRALRAQSSVKTKMSKIAYSLASKPKLPYLCLTLKRALRSSKVALLERTNTTSY